MHTVSESETLCSGALRYILCCIFQRNVWREWSYLATDGAPRMVTEQSVYLHKPQSSTPALGQFLYLTITVDRSVAKSLISYEYQNWSKIIIHDGLQINLGLSFSKPKKFSNTDQYKYSFGWSAVISLPWGGGSGLFWYMLFWDMDPLTQNRKRMLSRNRSSIISVVLFTITDRRPRQKLFVIFFDQFELI